LMLLLVLYNVRSERIMGSVLNLIPFFGKRGRTSLFF